MFPSTVGLGSRTRLRIRRRNVYYPQKVKFTVSTVKEEPKFDQWDLMQLKFGKMLGEDPNLTLAKIMGRKANSDASYLEIEKQFYKRKGKMVEVREVPFDVSDGKKSSSSSSSLDGLNLVRPVPKEGVKFEASGRPSMPEIKKPSPSVKRAIDRSKSTIPNVILRKPTLVNEPNVSLTLNMRNEQPKEKFSDMTLLRRPKQMSLETIIDKKEDAPVNVEAKVIDDSVGLKTSIEDGDDKVTRVCPIIESNQI